MPDLKLLRWRKARDCTGTLNCIEIFINNKEVFIRNSKNTDAALFMSLEDWEKFKESIKNDMYD